MIKEEVIIFGKEFIEILDNESDNFEIVEDYKKLLGVDHDLWEFEVILQRATDDKFFSTSAFYNYNCNMSDYTEDDEEFILMEVQPKQVMTTIYE